MESMTEINWVFYTFVRFCFNGNTDALRGLGSISQKTNLLCLMKGLAGE